jgi:S1-C subfamily serine protease
VKQGVYIQGIRRPGNASDAGLRRFDIILSIDGKEIKTLKDMNRIYQGIVSDEKRERKIRLEVFRSGLRYQFILDYSTRYKE